MWFPNASVRRSPAALIVAVGKPRRGLSVVAEAPTPAFRGMKRKQVVAQHNVLCRLTGHITAKADNNLDKVAVLRRQLASRRNMRARFPD